MPCTVQGTFDASCHLFFPVVGQATFCPILPRISRVSVTFPGWPGYDSTPALSDYVCFFQLHFREFCGGEMEPPTFYRVLSVLQVLQEVLPWGVLTSVRSFVTVSPEALFPPFPRRAGSVAQVPAAFPECPSPSQLPPPSSSACDPLCMGLEPRGTLWEWHCSHLK